MKEQTLQWHDVELWPPPQPGEIVIHFARTNHPYVCATVTYHKRAKMLLDIDGRFLFGDDVETMKGYPRIIEWAYLFPSTDIPKSETVEWNR